MEEQPQVNQQALAIVKALAYTENGGKVDLSKPQAGGSGEMKSIFQFMPDTWKQYSKQVFGNENTPLTTENESVVAYQKVNNWLSQGYDVNQIASMWNAGEQRPDAYKYLKGTNKSGVKFDTPGYAKKVSNYFKQFSGEQPSGNESLSASPVGQQTSNQQTPIKSEQNKPGLISPSMKQMKQVKQI